MFENISNLTETHPFGLEVVWTMSICDLSL